MDIDLQGRRALVTGASGGIGAAVAMALAGAGATVVLSGTREARLGEVAAGLPGEHTIIASDLSRPDGAEQLAQAVIDRGGGVDILVNNAGITRDNLAMRMKPDEWAAVFQVNVAAAFGLTRALLRPMIKNRFGRIISIGSVVGAMGNAGQANYAASKAALVGMTKSLAHELGPRGITVNCVAPGFIETAMTEDLSEEMRTKLAAQIPLACLGQVDDVSAGVVFLASDQARYITGHTLHINGGMLMV